MVKLSKSQLVRQLAKKSFNECDLDRDGKSPSARLLSLGPCVAMHEALPAACIAPQGSGRHRCRHLLLPAGAIDAKELHVGLLLVYDKLNKLSLVIAAAHSFAQCQCARLCRTPLPVIASFACPSFHRPVVLPLPPPVPCSRCRCTCR